ncbi:hypothetical protein B0H15DRAFT_1027768, partial [Mycena belliarum]
MHALRDAGIAAQGAAPDAAAGRPPQIHHRIQHSAIPNLRPSPGAPCMLPLHTPAPLIALTSLSSPSSASLQRDTRCGGRPLAPQAREGGGDGRRKAAVHFPCVPPVPCPPSRIVGDAARGRQCGCGAAGGRAGSLSADALRREGREGRVSRTLTSERDERG